MYFHTPEKSLKMSKEKDNQRRVQKDLQKIMFVI